MTPDRAAAEAFIRKYTRVQSPPACSEFSLHLADHLLPLWEDSAALLGERDDLPPPYWAFCWAGGQALCRYLLDHPEVVRGQRVLDFAAGSGAVGIAAALSGAAAVDSCDIDPLAWVVTGLNAALNGVTLTVRGDDLLQAPPQWDVVLAGDVCYEGGMSQRIWPWLIGLARSGVIVLLADPGRAYLPRGGLDPVSVLTVPTSREIENTETKTVTIYRVRDDAVWGYDRG